MSRIIIKRLMIGAVLLLSALLPSVPTALAGGWAVITLDQLPQHVTAGQPLTVGFMVRQHGRTPMEGLTPQVAAANTETNTSFTTAAKPQGKIGHYVATLTFPQPGSWRWSIQAFTIDQPMPGLTVLVATPVNSNEEPEEGKPLSLPLLAGALGLMGAAGTSLVWWRKRVWWAAALLLGAVLISGAGFVSAANETAQSRPLVGASSRVELGKALFVAKGCATCHHHAAIDEVPNISPGIGPNLTNFSAAPEYLEAWLKNPASIKPQTMMPNLELKKTEIEALITFLSPAEASTPAQFSPGEASQETSQQSAPVEVEEVKIQAAETTPQAGGPPAGSIAPQADLRPIELFLVRAQGTKGPLVAYDMANSLEYFSLPAGMLAADSRHYYAAAAQQNSTLLEVFDPYTSRLERRMTVEGRWTLSGVSPTGRWLALTRLPDEQERQARAQADQWKTEIQIVDAEQGQAAQAIQLDGNFEVETISADGQALFLIEHLPAANPTQYLVRLYELPTKHLQLGALRAKNATDELMTGLAWDGLASPDGRWLLTLYLNTRRNVAFIHTLDLENKAPLCIDLPSGSGNFDQLKYYALALAPNGQRVYAANAALGVVAEVSLETFSVIHTVEFPASRPAEIASRAAPAGPTNYSVLSKDGQRLYFSGGWDVWEYDTRSGQVNGPYLSHVQIEGLGLSEDEQRLYIALAGQAPLALDIAGDNALSLK